MLIIPDNERGLFPKNSKKFTCTIGERFGHLVVASEPFIWIVKWYQPVCHTCICDCGVKTDVLVMRLRSRDTRSCGCVYKRIRSQNGKATIHIAQQKNTKHGYTKGGRKPEYRVWQGIKERCLKPEHKSYKDYGGRGIKICERWMKFENFIADMGDRPSNFYSIERRDNDGDYEPGNCCWVQKRQQARNSRNNHIVEYNGKSQTLVEWSEELGMTFSTIRTRLHRGWSVERALSTRIK